MATCDICERELFLYKLNLPNPETKDDSMFVCGACRAELGAVVKPYTAFVRSFYAHVSLTEAEITARKARIAEARDLFQFVHCSEFGIAGHTLNVYTKPKGKRRRLVGYVDGWNVMNFLAGDTTDFRPINNWQNTFSPELKKRLGLA